MVHAKKYHEYQTPPYSTGTPLYVTSHSNPWIPKDTSWDVLVEKAVLKVKEVCGEIPFTEKWFHHGLVTSLPFPWGLHTAAGKRGSLGSQMVKLKTENINTLVSQLDAQNAWKKRPGAPEKATQLKLSVFTYEMDEFDGQRKLNKVVSSPALQKPQDQDRSSGHVQKQEECQFKHRNHELYFHLMKNHS
ncbi:hypothetical protein K435DRAFT_811933 [Dendrothele bispora CBS 962.96]|uniref:Uncharacterized protein n=1 Tax=Dendrothele bispora (strain CBS 962.96) TaxID=1314807 RepID=A0A4S8KQV1_DENBC|nr:hypothetical protein K435DRAFT_811933 [Dendrothele bispora CBS 962.96]